MDSPEPPKYERLPVMFQEMPQGWLSADDEILEAALTQARAALRDEATLVRRLSAYYRSDGDYAGSTFLDLNPALQRSA